MMRQSRAAIFWLLLPAWLAGAVNAQQGTNAFVNFETPLIHPVALSPGGNLLAVCNLPDNRVELLDVSTGLPSLLESIPTGLDPVSVRFRNTNELWVVNHISDSISILNVTERRVIFTLSTQDTPEDVVFAGNPERAYVSCSMPNLVQVFDPVSRQLLRNLAIEGERPKGLAVSPAGDQVYAAIFESGNGSTIIGRGVTALTRVPGPSAVDLPEGPHGGLNPPPNDGVFFNPLINPGIPFTNPPPRVGLIVRKNLKGQWMDDNQGDWTEYISGTNAAYTGRLPGWDLSDHDVAVIDTRTFAISYINRLMTTCMALAVHPRTGAIAVVGTEASNEIRFEPVLNGKFVKVFLALASPAGTNVTVKDLNPHLDYKSATVPKSERNKSIGDPRGIVWNSDGTRAYVTGMGSDNLIILDQNGDRAGPAIDLPEGPMGLVLDEPRRRLYILNRFQMSISVFDTTANTLVTSVRLFDPTPKAIKIGRKHLYSTHKNSGLGQVACGSCHVDSRFDRLAWDLGNPTGEIKKLTTNHNLLFLTGTVTNHFHPMKGPMVTQTLQDIITHEPFHWRGDRDGIEEFNGTFKDLQGNDAELKPIEMKEFKEFLASISFPPNPFRTLSNTMPASLTVTGLVSLGRETPRGTPLPAGRPGSGQVLFTQFCSVCHTFPTGLGSSMRLTNTVFRAIPPGTNGENHVTLAPVKRSELLPFKIPQLRNLPERIGFDGTGQFNRTGFGFIHDGSVDSLTRFIQDGFDISQDQTTADMVSFLICFSGSDLPAGSVLNANQPPGLPGKDVPAGTGRQFVVTNSLPALAAAMLAQVRSATSRLDIVVRGRKEGVPRGWFFNRTNNVFEADRVAERDSQAGLLSYASSTNPLVWMLVPRGSGKRIGVDRDEDGFYDRDEIDAGSDPASPYSVPGNNAPVIEPIASQSLLPGEVLSMRVQASDPEGGALKFSLLPPFPISASIDPVSGDLSWRPDRAENGTTVSLTVQATDNGTPALSNSVSFYVEVARDETRISLKTVSFEEGRVEIVWNSIPTRSYQIQAKRDLQEPQWRNIGPVIRADKETTTAQDTIPVGEATRFYRILFLE